jgi:hypothetical protein
MASMTAAPDLDLLRRIEAHRFDPADATQSFEDRLAGENGWPIAFARRAIAEYRRFAFLYASSGRPVAPSDVVDQVWHLHLLYTRNYWDVFCGQVLGRPLHHEPAAGVTGERPRLNDWYADTLARYREHFGEPPTDIWPSPAALQRTPKPHMVRINADQTLLLPRGIVAAILTVLLVVFVAALLAWTWVTGIG